MIPRYSRPEMAGLWTEEAKFQSWVEVEVAACRAWNKRGAIPDDALAEIESRAAFEVARIEEIEETTRHDVIAFTTNLAENIGEASRFVHMGLTSSDVTDTGQALRCTRSAEMILEGIDRMIAALGGLAKEHRNTLMPGRTHGMHAEPTTFGLKCLLWLQEAKRDRRRMQAARDAIAVGKISGAVGTHVHTGPDFENDVCRELGLTPAMISNQVLQRDRHAELLSALAIAGAGIERIALEIRLLQRTEVQEVFEPFRKGQKGSSAMPHKKNPVQCEQLCGLSRVLRGNLQAALENVALWHERDISHSSVERVILADSFTLLHYMLFKIGNILENLDVRPERMRANLDATHGLMFSQRLLLELIERSGMTREDAYVIIQRNAHKAWDESRSLAELLAADPEFTAHIPASDLPTLMDYNQFLKHVDALYERAGF